MIDNLKKFLNEDQDPKAIEKISQKLDSMLMRNEAVGYIGVQKKPVTVLPDSIVLTNKRIIICKPKNLGFSMEFLDYDWDDVATIFVKENILGSEFSFSTKSGLVISMDYIPKTQARKIATYAKEQLETIKNGIATATEQQQIDPVVDPADASIFEKNLTVIIPEVDVDHPIETHQAEVIDTTADPMTDIEIPVLSQEALFEKLQNYKKLLDNGLILQGEYDALKKEILKFM